MAYRLLQVSERYFHVRRGVTNDDNDEVDRTKSPVPPIGEWEVELLTTRICHHPLYQSPELWMAVLRDRVATSTATTTTSSSTSANTSANTDMLNRNPPRLKTTLTEEAKSVLRAMHGLGVNHARVTMFNKLFVASDIHNIGNVNNMSNDDNNNNYNNSNNCTGNNNYNNCTDNNLTISPGNVNKDTMEIYRALQQFADGLYAAAGTGTDAGTDAGTGTGTETKNETEKMSESLILVAPMSLSFHDGGEGDRGGGGGGGGGGEGGNNDDAEKGKVTVHSNNHNNDNNDSNNTLFITTTTNDDADICASAVVENRNDNSLAADTRASARVTASGTARDGAGISGALGGGVDDSENALTVDLSVLFRRRINHKHTLSGSGTSSR